MTRRIRPTVLIAGAICLAFLTCARARAQGVLCGSWNCCSQNSVSFTPTRINWTHTLSKSSQGNGGTDSAVWAAPLVDSTYSEGWSGWAAANTSGFNIVIPAGGATTTDGYSGVGDSEVIHRRNQFTNTWGTNLVGQAAWYPIWPDNVIQHVDFRTNGPTTAFPTCGNAMTGTLPCNVLTYTTSCALGIFTEGGTIVHELGHGYGFAHHDGYPSMMATSQIDVLSCELSTPGAIAGTASQRLTPAAAGHMCMRKEYGAPSGPDLGITPVVPAGGCTARTTLGCYMTPGVLREFNTSGTTSFTVPVSFTVMNNGDALSQRPVVEVYLSEDTVLDAQDLGVAWLDLATLTPLLGTIGTSLEEGETRSYTVQVEIDETWLNIGPPHTLLLKVDPLNWISETNEGNNVTDLRATITRTTP